MLQDHLCLELNIQSLQWNLKIIKIFQVKTIKSMQSNTVQKNAVLIMVFFMSIYIFTREWQLFTILIGPYNIKFLLTISSVCTTEFSELVLTLLEICGTIKESSYFKLETQINSYHMTNMQALKHLVKGTPEGQEIKETGIRYLYPWIGSGHDRF